MKKVLSTTKAVLTIFVFSMMLVSLSNNIYANEAKESVSYFTSDSDFPIPVNDEKSKQELEQLKSVITLTKEQEVAIYDLLFFKNDTLALPDQSSPRVALALQRISEEMGKVLTKAQVQTLKNQKSILSSLNLDLK